MPLVAAPYRISLANRGADATGVITVRAGSIHTVIPVNLPKGARKTYVTHIGQSYPAPDVILSTNRGSSALKIAENWSYQPLVLLVSDSAGSLGLRNPNNREQNDYRQQLGELACDPADMPIRAASYLGTAGVILGSGSERLSDEVIAALRNYVMCGGVLVIPGGASAPLLEDRRLADLLPISRTKPRTVTPRAGEEIGGLKLMGDFTFREGILNAGSVVKLKYGSVPMMAVRGYGNGRVVFLAINPFERPIDSWPGKTQLLAGVDFVSSAGRLGEFSQNQNASMYSSYYPSSGPYVSPYSRAQVEDNPFEVKPPDVMSVVGILFIYLLLVVPLNLLWLRKKGKGEWAWITTPLISFGFAGVFFKYAAGLYSADLSSRTSGQIVADERSSKAYFFGKSELFFPRGGSYDLKLHDVEYVTSNEQNGYRGPTNRPQQDIQVVDIGEIEMPNLDVGNLTFREFRLAQVMPGSRMFALDRKGNTLTIKNLTPWDFEGVEVRDAQNYFTFGSLAKGASATKLPIANRTNNNQIFANRMMVTATTRSASAGPAIGRPVESEGTRITYYAERTQ